MSKMTLAQKAAKKAAQQVRDRAFAARRREYRAACDEAEEVASSSPVAHERDSAQEAVEDEMAKREAALREIRQQIAELEEKALCVKVEFDASVDTKRAILRGAWLQFNEHREMLTAQVERRFPDMKDCWYVSQWAVPADVQAAMDAAAKAAAL